MADATTMVDQPDDDAAAAGSRGSRPAAGLAAKRVGGGRRLRTPAWSRDAIGCLISLVAHMVFLLVLGLWVINPPPPDQFSRLEVASLAETEKPVEEMVEEQPPEFQADTADFQEKLIEVAPPAEPDFSPPDDMQSATAHFDLSQSGELRAPRSSLLASIGGVHGSALEGRGAGSRQALVQRGGGSAGSENAVARALAWLKRHQNPNGSWSLDHRHGPCQGRCSDPGLSAPSLNAATALAVLPFLGAGQTHKEGNFRKTVGDGLYYLVHSMQVANNMGSFYEPRGTMYSHGLATIALCEAYAMTGDKHLAGPAQLALNYIAYAQDPVGGGWRYEPRQPGDTSVLGWQLMALKSGHMAYLNVSPVTTQKASVFLDSVQEKGGAFYGYVDAGSRTRFGTTAIGLLCRMYLGWKHDNKALKQGVEWLAKHGPASTDFYGNYYAMQVLFQYTGGEGPLWKRWNRTLRDQLINSQVRTGHADGSWYLSGNHSNEAGGRLYCTSLAAMTLEVYYRHLPIYGKQATEDDFPL